MTETTDMVPYDDFGIPQSAEELLAIANGLPDVPVYDGKPNIQLDQNSGKFTFGMNDREPLGAGDQLLVNVGSFVKGARLWKQDGKGKHLGPYSILVKANQPDPEIPDPKTVLGEGEYSRDGFKQAAGFVCRGLTGSAKDQTLEYITDAKMAVSAVKTVMLAVGEQVAAKNPAIYPIITASAELVNTKFGKKYKPAFKIRGFLTADQVRAFGNTETTATAPAEEVPTVEATPETVEVPRQRRRS